MLTDLFAAISKQAIAANMPRVIQTPEPEGCYTIIQPDGSITVVEAQRANHAHKLGDLTQVGKIVDRWTDVELMISPTVWFNRNGVTVIGGEKLRDRAGLAFEFSDPLRVLLNWAESRKPLSQRDLLIRFRSTFSGCISQDIIDLFKRVKFDSGKVIDTELSHVKSSVGATIRAEVTGAGVLPECLTFDVPLYKSGFEFSDRIQCALDADASSGQFCLQPVAGAIDDAFGRAETAIKAALKVVLGGQFEDVALFGTP